MGDIYLRTSSNGINESEEKGELITCHCAPTSAALGAAIILIIIRSNHEKRTSP
jgi:hypothetical protein